MTTRKTYLSELADMTERVSKMGLQLEKMIDMLGDALSSLDNTKAEAIIKEDDIVDDMERDIEKICIHLVAKQQPVATDLRRITSVMRLISDIERIADHCSDISEYVIELTKQDGIETPAEIVDMLEKVKLMVVATVQSFMDEDIEAVKIIREYEAKVDEYFYSIKNHLCNKMEQDASFIQSGINYLLITKYAERMADHAMNIAEWVAFIITGDLDEYMNR